MIYLSVMHLSDVVIDSVSKWVLVNLCAKSRREEAERATCYWLHCDIKSKSNVHKIAIQFGGNSSL